MRNLFVKLKRIIQGRCPKCGREKIDWAGYMSSVMICPKCDLK